MTARSPSRHPLDSPADGTVGGSLTQRRSDPELEAVPLAPAVTAAERALAPRNSSLDAARVLATFGVVFVHVAEDQSLPLSVSAVGRFGTSFYIIAATLFAVRSTLAHPERSFREDTKRRATRLLLPFLAWSSIYAAVYGWDAVLNGHTFENLARWWGPFAGTARHLWFLPFVLTVGITVKATVPRLARLSTGALFLLTTLGTAAVYFVFYRIFFFALPRLILIDLHLHRFDRWIEEIPLVYFVTCATLLGEKLLGENLRRDEAQRGALSRQLHLLTERARALLAGSRARLTLAAAFLLAFATTNWFYSCYIDWIRRSDTEGRFVAHLAGLCLLGAALLVPRARWLEPLAACGRHTYFVFLAHVLALEASSNLLYGRPGFGTWPFAFLTTLGIFALCSWLGAWVARVRPLRWLA